MSRYVVVEFEDNETADRLIEKLQDKAGIKITGVFQRPNNWCKCPFQIAGTNRPVSRGKKYGWWICEWCKKPRPGTQQLENTYEEKVNYGLHSRRYCYGVEHLSVYEIPNPDYGE